MTALEKYFVLFTLS